MAISFKNTNSKAATKIDRTQLGKLYPTPKTYEDRAREQAARELRRLKRIPHHFTLFTSLRLFVLAALASIVCIMAPTLILWAFNLVLCVLIFLAIVKWFSGEIATAFDRKGLNSTTFHTLYWIIIAPPTVAALYLTTTHPNIGAVIALYTVTFLAHHMVIGFIIKIMTRTQE